MATLSAGVVLRPVAGAPPPAPEDAGGKGHHLARLLEVESRGVEPRFHVPRFIVIGAAAFDRLVVAGSAWPADAAAAERRRDATRALAVDDGVRAEVRAALEAAGMSRAVVAVRSSAAAEDGSASSFAGQFETVLGVPADDDDALWSAVRRVWASAFLARAAAYVEQRGREAGTVRMAVVIQELVDPEVSGVTFSADPISGARDVAVVSAVYGLGEGLVSGDLDADTFRVARRATGAEVVERTIAHKPSAIRRAPGGTSLEPVPEALRDRPALSDAEACALASCAGMLEDAFGAPQDVEWALGPRRERYVLQARPITALPAPGETHARSATPPAGERCIWDNSNIVESYAGVTTALTFSFARSVYEDVYRQFCRLMGVDERTLEEHREVFANLLGLVRGRVYYQLLNWYRTLALLPGFQWNRGFMERMMGVREALETPPRPPGAGGKLRDFARLVRMLARMLHESSKLGREVPAFHARLERTLAPLEGSDLTALGAEELVALYRRLERELLHHWRAPLVNDFFAMVHFGLLGRLLERWLPGAPATLANDLLCGEGGIISTEPARRVMALARRAFEDPALARLLDDERDPAVLARRLAAEHPEFHREVERYIARFGDRCLEELKLETVTLREDRSFLFDMIRSYAARGAADPGVQSEREAKIRADAERLARTRLRGLRSWAFFAILARARARVRDRENLRFERTRVFGVVRRLFLALGTRLVERGRIERPRDTFDLTVEEVFAAFRDEARAGDLKSLAARRRATFERWAREPAPPDRFETRGPVLSWEEGVVPEGYAARPRAEAASRALSGTGCCPGVVRDRVRIVRDPREAHDVAGKILVAERTDPGWTLLFPAVKGLLVQRGSLLSHSAIVAREMGLPCIVGVAGLLDVLQDGEVVEMDGATGRIERLGR